MKMTLTEALEADDETNLCKHFYAISACMWRQSFDGKLDREDAIQESVLNCWRLRDQFDPERGEPSTFFFRVAWTAMNTYLRWTRRVKRQCSIVHLEDEITPFGEDGPGNYHSLLTTDVPGPLECLLLAKDIALIEDRLTRLNRRERAVIKRRFWRGQKLVEIGKALGVTAEAIRQTQKRALDKMERLV